MMTGCVGLYELICCLYDDCMLFSPGCVRLYDCICCVYDEWHLGKSFHVAPYDLRVGALQLAYDLKALVELGEHVHHRAREQSMLRRLLELEA